MRPCKQCKIIRHWNSGTISFFFCAAVLFDALFQTLHPLVHLLCLQMPANWVGVQFFLWVARSFVVLMGCGLLVFVIMLAMNWNWRRCVVLFVLSGLGSLEHLFAPLWMTRRPCLRPHSHTQLLPGTGSKPQTRWITE